MSAEAQPNTEDASLQQLSTTTADPFVRLAAELAAEVWVTKRRLITLERELVRRGVDLDIDHAAPLEAEDRTARDAFIKRVFGSLIPNGS